MWRRRLAITVSILGVLAWWVTAYQVQRRRLPVRSRPPVAATHPALPEIPTNTAPRLRGTAHISDHWLASVTAAFEPIEWQTRSQTS